MTLIYEMLNSMGRLALVGFKLALLSIFVVAYFAGGIHAVVSYGLSGLIAILIVSILSISFVDAISRSIEKERKKSSRKSSSDIKSKSKPVDKNMQMEL